MTVRPAIAGAALSLMLLSACATPPEDPEDLAAYEEANDPLEEFNRRIDKANRTIDRYVLRPIAGAYGKAVPSQLQDALRNFFDNLRAPVILANDLLQGEGERAGITVARFLTNSTLGLGGFIDTADKVFGLEFHDEDFGQTLAVWGVDEGVYLVLPLIGPSNPRDAVGIVVDSFLDPWNYLLRTADIQYGPTVRSLLNGIDLRARNIDALDEIERTSIDTYATLRSLYRQHRADEIRNGDPLSTGPAPVIPGPDTPPGAGIESPASVTQPTTWAAANLAEAGSGSDRTDRHPFGRAAGSGGLRVYVEAVDDFLGYRFTIEVDGRVELHVSARTCEALQARIRELLPSDWPALLNASSVAESLASCRSGGTSNQA